MQRAGVISTENLYQIKAPLATFDTIDLGDEEILYKNSHLMSAAQPRDSDIIESAESSSTSDSIKEVDQDQVGKVEPVKVSEVEVTGVQGEKEEKGKEGSHVKEKTSSDGASASGGDEVDFAAFKVKDSSFRKSSVKYEQIDSTSDASDPEPSPVPAIKSVTVGPSKLYDSDTDSSDSDSGYIRTGYISVTKGGVSKPFPKKPGKARIFNRERGNNSESDSTPTSSPRVSRPVLPPPPLSKEDSAIISKRKAYEKRLQRLKVTTNPIERPRSTTPINIVGLEEYACISSPEKSPQSGHLEKLKIRLPQDEFSRGKHSRRASKDSKDHVFDFNEELLFTHTRSALLLQEDGHIGLSPKRVLVPPTLSPALSPAQSPMNNKKAIIKESAVFSPKFIYCPENLASKQPNPSATNAEAVEDNWAKFDDFPASDSPDSNINKSVPPNSADSTVNTTSLEGQNDATSDWAPKFGEEEMLTVRIEEKEGKTVCDIQCMSVDTVHPDSLKSNDLKVGVIPNTDTTILNNENNDLLQEILQEISHGNESLNRSAETEVGTENGGFV